MMHVFIDTNILLNFYHFTKAELDELAKVFAPHEHGKATVHLTQQVCDEFVRHRETRIKDAMKRFQGASFAVQLPSFMKAYEEYEEMRSLGAKLEKCSKSIQAKANADIAQSKLMADALIKEIFAKFPITPHTLPQYDAACKRVKLGNPPGKKGSIGDAMNWMALLTEVPSGEDVHIISEDGDYFSELDEKGPHPFLAAEWIRKKKSKLRVYRSISDFLDEHFDGAAFPFDKEKDALIDEMGKAGSFACTHGIVAKLEKYGYFSLKEVERILLAAKTNNQVGLIVTDYDVSDFLKRVAVPRRSEIGDDEYIEILDKVAEEQASRL